MVEGYKLETRLSGSDSGNLHKSEDILSEFDPSDNRFVRAAIRNRNKLWDEGVIPYFIPPDVGEKLRKTIFSAMREWESNTCIKFVPEEPDHKFSIYFKDTGNTGCGCCSLIGKIKKTQYVGLNNGCGESGTLHELGHVIGFNHEQRRPDRDKYIKVLYENIKKEHRFNYHKVSENQYDSLGFAYDFKSIMHYSQGLFRIERKNTMEVIDSSNRITYNRHLSEIDIAQTRKLYRCPKCYFSLHEYYGMIEFFENSSISDEKYCHWFINRKQGEKIRFSVEYLNIPGSIDCASGFLDFRDGYWWNSPVIAKFCGNHSIEEIYESTKSSLLINYRRSHNSSLNIGFSLKYSVACGGKIEADSGKIESEQIEGYNRLTSNCFWTITVPAGYSVALTFDYINMIDDDNCTTEYVEIFEGNTTDSESLGKFCGKINPDVIISNNNTVSFQLISNKKKSLKDFSLSFEKKKMN